MNAFDLWLIIVGLAIGAGLAALVMVDLRRRDDDIAAREVRSEAAWIADSLRRQEIAADAEAVEEVLRLHRAYLAGIPDDGAWPPASPIEGGGAMERGPAAAAARPVTGDMSPAIGEATVPDLTDQTAQAEPANDELVYRAPAEDR